MLAQIVLVSVLLVLLFQIITLMRFVRLYIRASVNSVPIDFMSLITLTLRKVPPEEIVNARILSKHAGLEIPVTDMATLVLAGGHLDQVVRAMIAARHAGLDLTWQQAIEIDLAGKDVMLITQARIAQAQMESATESQTAPV